MSENVTRAPNPMDGLKCRACKLTPAEIVIVEHRAGNGHVLKVEHYCEDCFSDRDGHVVVEMALPLPLDIVGTFLQVVGKIYPDTRMDMNGGQWVRMIIPDAARPREVTEEDLEELRQGATAAEAWMLGLDDGTMRMKPREEIQMELSVLAHGVMEQFPEAKNSLEWTLVNKDDNSAPLMVLTLSRSPRQTPHQKRMALRTAVQNLIDSGKQIDPIDLINMLKEDME